MGYRFLEIATTPAVKAAQAANGSADLYDRFTGHRDFIQFTPAELEFIAARDSFYMATVSETGWPYVQHRGGPRGFLRALDERTLACADFRGNRQYISVGNLAANDRACLFLMDYPNRRRLKIYAHVEIRTATEHPGTLEAVTVSGYKARIERALVFHLEAFDWNCSQHITPRFTESGLSDLLEPIRQRMERLETENAHLKKKIQEAATDLGPA
jgi:predicted pyridoxine 5'-phosphate oxidase superfamily flavin-nucleotide-binding protein